MPIWNCPLGQNYAYDEFDDGVIDTNKWIVSPAFFFTESGGVIKPSATATTGSLQCNSFPSSGARKIRSRVRANFSGASSDDNYVGVAFQQASSFRGIALARHGASQRLVSVDGLTLASLVTGIAPLTWVEIWVENDGSSTITFGWKSGGVDVALGSLALGGVPSTGFAWFNGLTGPPYADSTTWEMDWASFRTYGGAGGLPCLGSPPSQARVLPSSTAKLSHVRILKGFRSDSEAQIFHESMKGAL